jgi:hypothetical protein
MAVAKSEEETRLNFPIQPFARQFFGVLTSVQLLAAKDSNVFFSLKLYGDVTTYLPFIIHSTFHRLSSFDFSWKQFNKLLQKLGNLRNVHRVGSTKSASFRFLYEILIVNLEVTIVGQFQLNLVHFISPCFYITYVKDRCSCFTFQCVNKYFYQLIIYT